MDRVQKVKEQFEHDKIDALFVNNPSNLFYLTNFRSSNAFVLITLKACYLFTDSRYLEKAKKQLPESWQVINLAGDLMMTLHKVMLKDGVRALGIESGAMTVSMHERFSTMGGQHQLVKTSRLIQQVRMIKQDAELRALRQSQKTNEQVLKLLTREIHVGMTEAELGWKLQNIAYDMKATGMSFPPIIAFGSHSSMPHHETSSKKKLRKGDMILIDMGLVYKDYASDMTRTFFTKTPTSQQKKIYDIVLRAQEAGVEAVKPGIQAAQLDHVCRTIITSAGYGDQFSHSTGHGIGLDVHELPYVSKKFETILQPGMVVTVEPGIYLSGRFGVRIEDMVEVTEKGGKSMNKFGKDFLDIVLAIR